MAAEIQVLSLPELVLRLFDVNGLKFGNFKMRTGEMTPIYIDMRVIWSYPELVVSTICYALSDP
jgi:uridine monophosphate synthetase